MNAPWAMITWSTERTGNNSRHPGARNTLKYNHREVLVKQETEGLACSTSDTWKAAVIKEQNPKYLQLFLLVGMRKHVLSCVIQILLRQMRTCVLGFRYIVAMCLSRIKRVMSKPVLPIWSRSNLIGCIFFGVPHSPGRTAQPHGVSYPHIVLWILL